MFKCKDISLRSSDYLENVLPARGRLLFALHLLICGRCREFVRHLDIAIDTFQNLPHGEMTPEDAGQLARRIMGRASED